MEQDNRITHLRFRERLYIPSSVVSRIASPTNHFVDIPNYDNADFSFVKVNEEVESCQNLMLSPTLESLNNPKTDILKELEYLQSKVTSINKKLDSNLILLREKQDKYHELVRIVNSRRKTNDKFLRDEVNCSCSSGCELF